MKRSKALQIALFYALFAGIWILVSDQMSLLMSDYFPPPIRPYLQTLKGGLFVVITCVLLYLLIKREVGQLKRAETRLKESQAIVNASPMIICLWRNAPRWPVEMISENATETFGYAPEEFTSEAITFAEVVHPDDMERISEEIVENIKVLKRDAFAQSYRIITKEGDIKWVEDRTLVRRNEQGRITHFQGIVFDVTEKKLAEENSRRRKELLQTIMDNIPLMIVFNEADGRIRWANRTWESTLGWRLDEAESSDIMRSLYPDPADHTEVMEFIRRAEGKWGTFKVHTRDGSVLETSWINMVLSDGTNIGIGQDVTEFRAQERKRRDLEVQLLQSQKMEAVGRLAGGVAHDFNNLLAVVLGYAELLLPQCSPGDAFEPSLRKIVGAAERAKNLTRQLLAFGRKQMLTVNTFDINSVIRAFEKMIRRTLSEDIAIELALTDQPCTIKADISQIEQVLMNLVLNARDAMPDGGTLTIETAVRSIDETYAAGKPGTAPGSYIMVAISDTGTGMDQQTSAHIFEPFFTTKGEESGTGLGLSTAYGIVKQHEGNIWVYSEPGQGTIFKIYLPHVSEEATAKESKKAPPPFAPSSISARILVVEDDDAVRDLTSTLLEGLGFDVISSEDATDAIRLAKEIDQPLDLLLTDVVMPDMKGPEVYRQIVEHQPDIKVLYMSGYTENVIFKKGILQEGIDFIQKPFTLRALHEKISRILSPPSV